MTGPDGVLFDASMWSWSAALPRDCGGTNRSFSGPAFCDRESNVMLLEVLFNEDCGGRGKQARQLHPVKLSASGGCVARAAANGPSTPP